MSLVVRFVLHLFSVVLIRVEKSMYTDSLMVKKIVMLVIHWFHLEHEVAITCVDILWVEDTAI